MPEGGGFVVLHHAMGEPGKGITGEDGGEHEPGIAQDDGGQQQQDRQPCAADMDDTRRRLAVGGEIDRPEGFVIGSWRHRVAPTQSKIGSA